MEQDWNMVYGETSVIGQFVMSVSSFSCFFPDLRGVVCGIREKVSWADSVFRAIDGAFVYCLGKLIRRLIVGRMYFMNEHF